MQYYPQIRCEARGPDLLSRDLRYQRSQPCGHLRGERHDAALRKSDPVRILRNGLLEESFLLFRTAAVRKENKRGER